MSDEASRKTDYVQARESLRLAKIQANSIHLLNLCVLAVICISFIASIAAKNNEHYILFVLLCVVWVSFILCFLGRMSMRAQDAARTVIEKEADLIKAESQMRRID